MKAKSDIKCGLLNNQQLCFPLRLSVFSSALFRDSQEMSYQPWSAPLTKKPAAALQPHMRLNCSITSAGKTNRPPLWKKLRRENISHVEEAAGVPSHSWAQTDDVCLVLKKVWMDRNLIFNWEWDPPAVTGKSNSTINSGKNLPQWPTVVLHV